MIPISGQQAVFCWGALPGSIYQRSHYSTVHSRELFTCRGLGDHGFDRCAGRGLLMTLGRRRDIISDKRSHQPGWSDKVRWLQTDNNYWCRWPLPLSCTHMGAIADSQQDTVQEQHRWINSLLLDSSSWSPPPFNICRLFWPWGIIIRRYNGTEDGGVDNNNSIISWSIWEGLTHSVGISCEGKILVAAIN